MSQSLCYILSKIWLFLFKVKTRYLIGTILHLFAFSLQRYKFSYHGLIAAQRNCPVTQS